MGISENVYIDRKALKMIDELTATLWEWQNKKDFVLMIAEIRGIIDFANALKEGDDNEDEGRSD